MQLIVGRASHIHAAASGHERQRDVTRSVRSRNAYVHRNAGVLFPRLQPALSCFAFEILLLKLRFEFAECWIDGNPFGEDINLSLNRNRRQRAITTIVDMIDRGGEYFLGQTSGYFRLSL